MRTIHNWGVTLALVAAIIGASTDFVPCCCVVRAVTKLILRTESPSCSNCVTALAAKSQNPSVTQEKIQTPGLCHCEKLQQADQNTPVKAVPATDNASTVQLTMQTPLYAELVPVRAVLLQRQSYDTCAKDDIPLLLQTRTLRI